MLIQSISRTDEAAATQQDGQQDPQPGTQQDQDDDFADWAREVRRLAEARNAVILAHNYQVPWVQDVADHVGDSLALSRLAARSDAEVIVFCGVHFMAETAKLLAPGPDRPFARSGRRLLAGRHGHRRGRAEVASKSTRVGWWWPTSTHRPL